MSRTHTVPVLAAGIFLTLFAGPTLAQTTRPAVTLGLGDAAPAIQVAGWAKGTPVAAFEPGKVYVVEFWATWCGPCKRSIPHLTELAKQYAGRVSIVGVSVWEHPDEETDDAINAIVNPFVKSMGDKMDYHVAVDGVAGVMAKTWLKPAGQDGIPASFVIDGQGRIAWIGLPTGLDAVLEKVTAGTWSIEAEKKRVADAAAAEAPRKAALDKISVAFQAQDGVAVIAAIDDAEAKFPGTALHPDLISVKLQALFKTEPAAAVAYVQKLTAPGGSVAAKPDFVWSIVRVIPDKADSFGYTAAEWKAISTACEASIAAAKPFSSLYEKYSILLSHAGDRAGAVANQKKAVELSAAYIESHAGQVNKADTDQLARQKQRLDALLAGS